MQDEIYIASKDETVDDPDSACKLSDFEIELWLDENMDVEDLSGWQVASLSPYAPGVDIFGTMEKKTLARLGVGIVEGDHPGTRHQNPECRFNGRTHAIRHRSQTCTRTERTRGKVITPSVTPKCY